MGAPLIGALLCAGPALAAGPRIVSMNPCVDAVLVRVADHAQIAGISHYSQDEQATSMDLALARRFHATSGTAEEIVALRPDHVIAGPHVSPATVHALERMNIRLTKLPVAESVDESLREVRTIAEIAGHPARGAALAAEIEAAVAAARAPAGAPIDAVIWQGGGVVPGAGTLADELLRQTGFRNLSAEYGLAKWDVLPLEYLVAKPPRVLLSVGTGDAGLDRMTSHPAARELARRVTFHRYPFRLLQCAGPTIIDAVATLAQVRREVTP